MGMAIPEYGVYGDLINDDWSGLQQWANDGITSGKKLVLPAPPGGGYRITKPLVFNLPNSFNENLGISTAPLILEGEPGYNGVTGSWAINYEGPNGTSALIFNALQFATIKGITVNLGWNGTASNQVAFDIQVSDTLPNFDALHLIDCHVRFQGTGGNHIAYRFGQAPNGQSNITGVKMDHCSVDGEGAQYGSIGCQIGGGEVIPLLAVDCQFAELGAAWVTGSIQSVLVAPVEDNAAILPIQNALFFPTSGTAVVGSIRPFTYTYRDHTNRSINDGVLNGTTTLTSNSDEFSPNDVGAFLSAAGIPVRTYIKTYQNPTTVVMSQAATTTASGVAVSITRNVLTGCNALPFSITDGVLNGTTTLTSNTANFSNFDQGASLAATGIPAGTTIQSVTNSTTVVMSQAATTTASGVTVTITDTGPGVAPASVGESVQQSVPNQGLYSGGGDTTWLGCGGGRNNWDFLLQASSTSVRIFGGRWEGWDGVTPPPQGNHFLQASTVSTADNFNVLVEGLTLAGYREPPDFGGVFTLNGSVTLRLVALLVPASAFSPSYVLGNDFINASNSWFYSSITVEDCCIQATTPFWTLNAGAGTAVNLRNVQLIPAQPALLATSIVNMVQIPPVTLTDNPGGTVTIDLTQGNYFILAMTGSSNSRTLAFVNALPTQTFTILAQQSSSGSNSINWPAAVRWQGGSQPGLSGPGKWDRIVVDVPAAGTYLGTAFSDY